MTTLTFQVREYGSCNPPCHEVIPAVDGTYLTELVDSYERKAGFRPPFGYAGIVPEFSRSYGDLAAYYLGESPSKWWKRRGKIAVLGCICGNLGCWPLHTRVTTDDSHVGWSEFEQPHKPDRDYSGVGPFVFERTSYVAAVQVVKDNLAR